MLHLEKRRGRTRARRDGRLRATSLCAGPCLFLVTRATTVGLEHGGPPTAALGPYHSAMILGGVPHNLGRGRCRRRLLTGHRRRAMPMPCPGQKQTHALVLLALLELERVSNRSTPCLVEIVQQKLSLNMDPPSVEPTLLHECEHQYGRDLHADLR